ncbi:putative metal-dependent HD superfamily phosphohydrolase [Dokdonia sp. Hel_I_63]|uniref:Pycsar system effector family protein n=1 Tax=unclassified Dokdonia TaxID=2615033 RepID=UPI00020A7739|nr:MULTISPECIES: Pycsar system effector family protein [unclassified Dokdonia]AEE20912.1 metal-dependent phosphohydrolase HD sub domain protein [Dokdonia sp. 4H-3-7-5]TVZ22841.1 putative metal-dependent HD superfamily phosphohydrolase [Dokdonia sp. Hel_I_63]
MTELLEKTDRFISELFDNELPKTCIYHNYVHTKRVLKSTQEIIDNSEESLKDEEKLILQLSALLHDIGYVDGTENHEARSAEMAETFLKEQGVEATIIEEVKKVILATDMRVEPQTYLEQVLRDADASHFAKDYFPEASEYLRQELKIKGIKEFTTEEWNKANIEMFTIKHRYYTHYAQENWKPKKDNNLNDLTKARKKAKKARKKEKLKVQLKDASPEKGIQSMYRIALRNHIKLSDIADTKANILLSVNAIVISLALANLIPKLESPSNAHLIYPTAVFVLFAMISMIMSIIATRPNVTRGEFDREDVKLKKVNLLFFGNFHKMKLEDYEWAIGEMLQDKDYIYSALTKDLYFLGVVLDRKYKLLRITYNIFMVGIIISVLTFAVFFAYRDQAVEVMEDVESLTNMVTTLL